MQPVYWTKVQAFKILGFLQAWLRQGLRSGGRSARNPVTAHPSVPEKASRATTKRRERAEMAVVKESGSPALCVVGVAPRGESDGEQEIPGGQAQDRRHGLE